MTATTEASEASKQRWGSRRYLLCGFLIHPHSWARNGNSCMRHVRNPKYAKLSGNGHGSKSSVPVFVDEKHGTSRYSSQDENRLEPLTEPHICEGFPLLAFTTCFKKPLEDLPVSGISVCFQTLGDPKRLVPMRFPCKITPPAHAAKGHNFCT